MQRGRDDVTYYDHVQKSCPSARQYGTYHSRRSFMRSYRDIGRPKPFLSHRPSGSSSRLTNRSDGRKRRAPAPFPPPPHPLSFLLEKEKEEKKGLILFFHVRTALSCIERFFVLYTTLRKSNLLCTVPFFLPRKVCKPYDATVGCPKCKG